MKFEKIYNETVSLWPKEIDISDSIFFEESDGLLSKSLISAREIAENNTVNEWQDLMVWEMYVAIHSKAIELIKTGNKQMVLNIKGIDVSTLKKSYFESLKVEGYEDMLEEYKENNKSQFS